MEEKKDINKKDNTETQKKEEKKMELVNKFSN